MNTVLWLALVGTAVLGGSAAAVYLNPALHQRVLRRPKETPEQRRQRLRELDRARITAYVRTRRRLGGKYLDAGVWTAGGVLDSGFGLPASVGGDPSGDEGCDDGGGGEDGGCD